MGTASGEIKGLILVLTFLSTFFLIVTMIPSGFLINGNEVKEYREIRVPKYFEAVDVQSFAESILLNLTSSGVDEKFTLGGWNVRFEYWQYFKSFSCYTYNSWWIFNWDFDDFHWYDVDGIDRSKYYSMIFQDRQMCYLEDVDNLYENYGNRGLKWILKNGRTQFVLFFGFNETTYDSPSEALFNDDLHVLICVNFDKVNTSFNAWNLIGAILFFQMPDVHPVINMLIAIPIWTLIAYLVYVLILKAIPFVGG